MGPQAKHISGDGESSQAGKTQARNVHWDHGGNELSLPWPRRALRTVAGAAEATGAGETRVEPRLPERARAPGAVRTWSQTTQGPARYQKTRNAPF